MQSHISDGIRADLGKLDPAHRREILRVAGAYSGSSIIGADRKLPANMDQKVLPSRRVPEQGRAEMKR
jgi:hypothetical protein